MNQKQSSFKPGLELSEEFYKKAVCPILKKEFPGLEYAAALLGHGSEVQGYDTEISTDHHWGPRVQIFLKNEEMDRFESKIWSCLSSWLPHDFSGYSTNFGSPDEHGVQLLSPVKNGILNHRVEIFSVDGFCKSLLGKPVDKDPNPLDWLIFPQQELLCITGGKVFHDETGELTDLRDRLNYFPHEVWLYLLSCQWQKISQEEAFLGRCGHVGDELGSALVCGRLIRELMRLCFLMEKVYFPYSKWFGTAFKNLKCSHELSMIFSNAMKSVDWETREKYLGKAYESIARMHNSLCITKPMNTKISKYHDRPYYVIQAERFSKEIFAQIQERSLRKLKSQIGSVDQFLDSTDALSRPWKFASLVQGFDE